MTTDIHSLKPLFNQWLREALAGGVDSPCRLSGGLYLGALDQLIRAPDFYTDGCIRKSTAIACRLIHNTSQTIPHNTWTQIAFNSPLIDTDTLNSTANQITIRTEGLYLFGLQVCWEHTASTRYRHIRLNYADPGTVGVLAADSNTGISGGGNLIQACYTVWNANRGAVITADAYQWDTAGAPGAANLLFQWLYAPVIFAVRLA